MKSCGEEGRKEGKERERERTREDKIEIEKLYLMIIIGSGVIEKHKPTASNKIKTKYSNTINYSLKKKCKLTLKVGFDQL